MNLQSLTSLVKKHAPAARRPGCYAVASMKLEPLKLPVILGALAALVVQLAPTASRADEKLYEIKKSEPKVATGASGTASITIATRGGWHMNAEAPITLKLSPPAGISVPKPKLGRGDLAQSTKETARFDIAFSATETGQKVIDAETHFVICQESACKPVKETLALNIEVTSPASPPREKTASKTAKTARK